MQTESPATFASGAVDKSKLNPPRTGSRLIPRQSLQSRLLEARRRSCIVLRGPAGSGKTTTLAVWRQALLPLGFDVAWLNLGADDNRPARFVDCLLASLAQVEPGMVRDALLLEDAGDDPDAAERLIITLVRGIAAHGRELTLILDDLHSVTDVGIHQMLQWLLEYAPGNLHLVLATRSAAPLSLARLRSQQQTLELDLNDLRLSADETAQYLSQSVSVEMAELQRIHEMTDGWIAGLQLVVASRRKARPHAAQAFHPVRDNQAFAQFFDEEVLAQLSADERELLLHMAVCERFCASLCAALLDKPQAHQEVGALLHRLEQDNLFLIALSGGDSESWYRLHPLLRETILRSYQERPTQWRQSVHRRAWRWLWEHGQLTEAVPHAVQAGDAQPIADRVEQHGESLYASGNLRLMTELVRQLPAEQIQASTRLRLQQARLLHYARDFAACAESLRQLQRDIAPDDLTLRFRLAIQQSMLAVQQDDLNSALPLLQTLLNPPADADAHMLGASANLLSWLYMQQGEFERARKVQTERPALLVNGAPFVGTAAGSLQGRCLIGLSLAMEGQIRQAERLYREVLYEAEQGGKTCADALYLSTALLGEVLYETNEIDAALELLEPRVDVLERVSIPDSVLRVLEVLGKCHWRLGNRAEAFAYLDRLDDYGIRLGLDRLQAYAMAWQIHWHLQLGEVVAAEAKLQRLDAIDARHPTLRAPALPEIHTLRENAHLRWMIAQGDLHAATQRIDQVIALCEAGNRQLGVTRLRMLSAVLDDLRGSVQAARTKALEALRAGHRLGQIRSLLDAHPEALRLVRDIAGEQPLDPVLGFYLERLIAAGDRPQGEKDTASKAATSAPAVGIEALSEREMEVLRLLAQALPNKKIARAMGLSHETVKWHLRHIFSKLSVSSRDEAAAWLRDQETR